jgi:hypothetical protein
LSGGTPKFLQVKTLTQMKSHPNIYGFNNTLYDDNMLIAGVDNARAHFVLFFYRERKKEAKPRFAWHASGRKTAYDTMIFTTQEAFLSRLVELLPDSASTQPELPPKLKLEAESMVRLEAYCTVVGLNYRRHDTNGDAVDAWIAGVPV